MLDRSGLGVLLLVNGDRKFERTVTDGDLRRMLLEGATLDQTLTSIAERRSIVLGENDTRREALEIMQKHTIDHLPVVDDRGGSSTSSSGAISTSRSCCRRRIWVKRNATLSTRPFAPTGSRRSARMSTPSSASSPRWSARACGRAQLRHGGDPSRADAARRRPGDDVFCSTFTFAASVNPIVYQGARPSSSIASRTAGTCPRRAGARAGGARRKGRLPKAVIVVDLYGQSADLDPHCRLRALRRPARRGCGRSARRDLQGQAAGTLRTHRRLLVQRQQDHHDLRRRHARVGRDGACRAGALPGDPGTRSGAALPAQQIGYNYRMSNVLAGIGRGQLPVLDDRVAARRAVYDALRERRRR